MPNAQHAQLDTIFRAGAYYLHTSTYRYHVLQPANVQRAAGHAQGEVIAERGLTLQFIRTYPSGPRVWHVAAGAVPGVEGTIDTECVVPPRGAAVKHDRHSQRRLMYQWA
jgi:hypothetical protein